MARARPARPARGRQRSHSRARRRWPLIAASAAAIVGVVAIIWASNAFSGTSGVSDPTLQAGRVRGLATAKVTIDEYADFQCPACGQFARTTEQQLLSTYIASGQVKIVFHHFAFLGLESNWAAEAAECANEQGRFWDMHDRLYASQAGENKGAFTRANLKRIGNDLGLGPSFAACVDSGRYAQAVRDATQEGSDREVRATPTLIIGGQKIEGAASYDQLKVLIDAALAR